MRNILTVCLSLFVAASPLAAQSAELVGVRDAAAAVLKGARADGAGLTVTRGSRELHRSLHGAFAGDQTVRIASASKWLTVATILTLVEDGTLDLDLPVARYVEEFERADKRRVTLRQRYGSKATSAASAQGDVVEYVHSGSRSSSPTFAACNTACARARRLCLRARCCAEFRSSPSSRGRRSARAP